MDVPGDPDADLRQTHRDDAAVGDEDRPGQVISWVQADTGRQRGADAQQHALAVVVDGVLDRFELDRFSTCRQGSKVTLEATT